jgi:hypothetical protein
MLLYYMWTIYSCGILFRFLLWDEAIKVYEIGEFPHNNYQQLDMEVDAWYAYREAVYKRLQEVMEVLHRNTLGDDEFDGMVDSYGGFDEEEEYDEDEDDADFDYYVDRAETGGEDEWVDSRAELLPAYRPPDDVDEDNYYDNNANQQHHDESHHLLLRQTHGTNNYGDIA